MTVSESLLQISELTKQNLQILQMLNDSFYTRSNHLTTTVGDTTYTIPSYIALENKINHVQDAINNLVHAAKSGEAWFNFDGNSKEICVRGYQAAPNPITLKSQSYFEAEVKEMFKDMLTPQPYLNFDMSTLPEDVNQVIVKKIIPYAGDLKNRFKAFTGVGPDKPSSPISYKDVISILQSGDSEYVPGRDYIEYESVYTLPIRNCTKSGTYVIEEIITDQITENLENILQLRISASTPLYATSFDGVTTTKLQYGDILTSYDGSAKLKILDQVVNTNSRIINVQVLSGEYVNPIAAGVVEIPTGKDPSEVVSDYSILKYYATVEGDRELHIPLEEDPYVFIAAAPVNARLNTQSEWGDGLYVHTDSLHDENGVGFRTYYNENVLNIGDAIAELTSVCFPSITKFTEEEMGIFNRVTDSDLVNTQVVHINKHLNDSESVKSIRTLYSQKKQYQVDLEEVQGKIIALQDQLAEISFDDMSGTRSAYSAQIADLKDQQNNLITSINKIIDAISIAANNSEVPIEGAKYRVRGYLDVNGYINRVCNNLTSISSTITRDDIQECIIGVQTRYRYRNSDIPQANIAVIGDEFLFTEWSLYEAPKRERNMSYKNGKYTITFNDTNEDDSLNYAINEIKFNQIDIPITQGENVELQSRVIWGFGYPFVTVASEWTEPITVEFPAELTTDVQVVTIIEENNNDIERYRFENILNTNGITKHVDDEIDDQDVKYFHRPESISSGFYTAERRIIPLKDKLLDLSNRLLILEDTLNGTFADALKVSCLVDGLSVPVVENGTNNIHMPAFSLIENQEIPTGSAYMSNGNVYIDIQFSMTNVTSHAVNIFSLFPGARTKGITDGSYKVDIADIMTQVAEGENVDGYKKAGQVRNQFVYYRALDPYNSDKYNVDDKGAATNKTTDGNNYIDAYPIISTDYDLCFDTDSTRAKKELAPGESLTFNVRVKYRLQATYKAGVHFEMGFNIKNSLYNDPLYYHVNLIAKYNQSVEDALQAQRTSVSDRSKYNVTVR